MIAVIPNRAVGVSDLGGIDLTAKRLNIETQGEGIKFNLPDAAALGNMEINGLRPIIFKIAPLDNLPVFLGSKLRNP